jgi:hypothetical protein
MEAVSGDTGNEAALWGRLLDPADAALSPDAARYLLSIQFPASDVERMHELAAKAREVSLTPGERVELDIYEQVGHAVSLMKLRARQALRLRG